MTLSEHGVIRKWYSSINPLTPNDPYRGRTAPLTSKRCILYIYSTNIGTEYFKHGIYSPFFFPLQNAVCFIILTYLVPVLFTFYIQVVLKFKKNNSGAKNLTGILWQNEYNLVARCIFKYSACFYFYRFFYFSGILAIETLPLYLFHIHALKDVVIVT